MRTPTTKCVFLRPLHFLASNAGSELFISTDDNPKNKAQISFIEGGFPSDLLEFNR